MSSRCVRWRLGDWPQPNIQESSDTRQLSHEALVSVRPHPVDGQSCRDLVSSQVDPQKKTKKSSKAASRKTANSHCPACKSEHAVSKEMKSDGKRSETGRAATFRRPIEFGPIEPDQIGTKRVLVSRYASIRFVRNEAGTNGCSA